MHRKDTRTRPNSPPSHAWRAPKEPALETLIRRLIGLLWTALLAVTILWLTSCATCRPAPLWAPSAHPSNDLWVINSADGAIVDCTWRY